MHKKNPYTTKSSNSRPWRVHLRVWQKSGLSRAEYCRQQNLSYHAFKYWEKKLIGKKSSKPAFISVPALRIEQSSLGRDKIAKLKVDLGGRYRIEVHDDFSSVTLSRLISTLGSC